jgi:type II secretory pathway component PulK
MTSPRGMQTRQQGFVLVCVLWVLAILTVVSVGFGRRAMLDRQAAAYELDHTQAMFMARGAVMRGMIELDNKVVYDAINKQSGRTSTAQKWARKVNLLEDKSYFVESENEEFKDDICMFTIRDEAGYISLNSAPDELLTAAGLSRAVIRKIDFRRSGGIEEGNEAAGQQTAQPFQTIEELRSFKGIRDRDWFGTDRKPGLKDILTACPTGNKVNINTAPEEVLKVIPDLGDGAVKAIVNYRAGPDGELWTDDDQDFPNLGEVASQTGISAEAMNKLQTFCTTDSNLFTITGIATRRQGKVRATCVGTVGMFDDRYDLVWREELLDS